MLCSVKPGGLDLSAWQLTSIYILLAVKKFQSLTVSYRIVKIIFRGIPIGWERLSLSLYWLPAIVLLFNLRDDISTLAFGESVGKTITWWVISIEFVLLVATWLLTLNACESLAR